MSDQGRIMSKLDLVVRALGTSPEPTSATLLGLRLLRLISCYPDKIVSTAGHGFMRGIACPKDGLSLMLLS